MINLDLRANPERLAKGDAIRFMPTFAGDRGQR